MDAATQSRWASMLGINPIASANLLDAIWETLTDKADPTGDTAVPPLIPTSRSTLDLHLGGHSLVRRKAFSLAIPEARLVIASMQRQYASLRGLSRAGKIPEDHYRRVLDYWGKQFRVGNPEDIFIPRGLPIEKPLPHATTFTESFDTANSTTLGPDLTWTETVGNLRVNSNRCQVTTEDGALNEARAEHDLSSSNNYTQCVINRGASSSASVSHRACSRSQSGARTHYMAVLYGDQRRELYKRVANTSTLLSGPTSQSWSNNDVLRSTSDGSSISMQINGSTVVTVTDTSISTGLRGTISMQASTTNIFIDSFEMADLAAGAFSPAWAVNSNSIIGAGAR
jgi:hypothetical protein